MSQEGHGWDKNPGFKEKPLLSLSLEMLSCQSYPWLTSGRKRPAIGSKTWDMLIPMSLQRKEEAHPAKAYSNCSRCIGSTELPGVGEAFRDAAQDGRWEDSKQRKVWSKVRGLTWDRHRSHRGEKVTCHSHIIGHCAPRAFCESYRVLHMSSWSSLTFHFMLQETETSIPHTT